jgi:hypothetical protein
VLIDDEVYAEARQGDTWRLPRIREELAAGSDTFTLSVDGQELRVRNDLKEHEREQLLAGGLLRYLKEKAAS